MNRTLVREVWDLVLPVILQGMVVTVVFFTDRLLLGQYDETTLASMQVSGPLLWSIFSVFAAFIAGTMAVIGRAVGANDPERAQRTLSSVLVFGFGVGIVVASVCMVLRPWFADVLAGGGGTEEAQSMAIAYMGVVLLGLPLNMVHITGVTALQADGDTRTPMWISAIQGLLNLVLSWVLLWGYGPFPELGIVGAGIGSLASFCLGGVAVLFILARRTGHVRLRPWFRPEWSALMPVLRISGPAFAEKIVFHTAFVAFAAYVGHLGTKAMTANQALIAIESLGFMVAHGFSVAAAAMVAQKMGAGAIDEAAECGWISAGLGTLVLGAIGLLFWVIPEPLIRCFTDDNEIVAMAVPCLRVAAVVQPLMAICEAMAGGLRGAGDTRTPLLAALFGPVLFRLIGCWFFAFHLDMGLIGIWYGTSLDWLIRVVFLSIMFHRGKWKQIVIA
jgi:MATE family multidrug resistance protein